MGADWAGPPRTPGSLYLGVLFLPGLSVVPVPWPARSAGAGLVCRYGVVEKAERNVFSYLRQVVLWHPGGEATVVGVLWGGIT